VYLKVSPIKGVQRFGAKKLAPRYVGRYQVIERKGEVAYKIQLPKDMSMIFPMFHISQLKKCLRVLEERVEVKDLKIGSDLVYQEQLIEVLDTKDQITKNIMVKTYKIMWSHHDERDATWETNAYMREVYPDFYQKWLVILKSRSEIPLRGKDCNTPGVHHIRSWHVHHKGITMSIINHIITSIEILNCH
jgi:hypothetical protein